MNIQRKEKGKGFTIIEVVLVLAIAGLIFMMVFIALPALQRGQRDTQRRSDVTRVNAQLTSYQSNNRGNIPAINDWDNSFKKNYMLIDGSFVDPSGADYTISTVAMPATATFGTIYVSPGNICNGESLSTSGLRKVAFRMKLEGAGVFCVNN